MTMNRYIAVLLVAAVVCCRAQEQTTVRETPLYDPCVPNPCHNAGTCTSYSGSSYYCTCPKNVKGQRCQLSSGPEPPCKLRNTDFKWDDLNRFENVNETMCQKFCTEYSPCQYWTYHQYQKVCWTKRSRNYNSGLPGRIERHSSVVSGFKNCPGDCEFKDTDFFGDDLDIIGLPIKYTYYNDDASECERLCAETAACQFWSTSYIAGTQRCFRKRSLTGLPSRIIDKVGTVSGFKTCPNGFHRLSLNNGYGPVIGK